jgi:hypothetical protein
MLLGFQLPNHVHLPCTAFHWSILFAEVQTKLVSMWSPCGASGVDLEQQDGKVQYTLKQTVRTHEL